MDRERDASRLRVAIKGIDRDKLRALVEDPDCDPDTAKVLEDRNLMIWIEAAPLSTKPSPDPELGIGRKWT